MLTTPKIKNFNGILNAIKENVIYFEALGGDQVFKNELEIYKASDNSMVHSNISITFQFKHVIPIDTLTNGETYKLRIRTYNSDNDTSQWSEYVNFKTLSDPIFSITNLGDGTIKNQTYVFQGEYSHEQDEPLRSYRFALYDSNKNLLSITDELRDGRLNYEFGGLQDNESYYIEYIIKISSGEIYTTGLINFYVDYVTLKSNSIITLTNNKKQACVDIELNIKEIIFQSVNNTYEYINDEFIDLRNDVIYTDDTNGFYLNLDKWTMCVKFISGNDGEILKLSNMYDDCISISVAKERVYIRYYKNGEIMFNRWHNIENLSIGDFISLWVLKDGHQINTKITTKSS